jgi:hypothetical protein
MRGLMMLLGALALAGCKGKGTDTTEETGPTLETGWFTDTANPETGEPTVETGEDTCEAHLVETEPAPGESGWYWRDALVARTAAPGDYPMRLVDESGGEATLDIVWDETGTLATITPTAPLAPDTEHTLELTDCGGLVEVPFRTSTYGLPLEDGAAGLLQTAWQVDLSASDWLEPEGFGTILALYFTDPILLGVQWADEHVLDLIGAPGFIDATGVVKQNMNRPSWDLPAASFTETPYFEISGAQIVLYVDSDISAPVYDVRIAATIAPDGRSIAGGIISGVGDTRTLGGTINQPNNESAICDFAAGLGVECIECPDGEPYCLEIYATQVYGSTVDGLVVLPVAATP